MKKVIAACYGLLLLAVPALALADGAPFPLHMSIKQLTTIVAALKAQEAALGGQPIACAVVSSKESVRVGEPFVLAWGSVGAMSPGDDPAISMFEPNGASTVAIQRPGKFMYSFTFYGRGGGTTTCAATILVTK